VGDAIGPWFGSVYYSDCSSLNFWRLQEKPDGVIVACWIFATIFNEAASYLLMAKTPFDIELDEMTLARARRGDVDAFEIIFRKFQQPAFSVAFRICQCREAAQEITQEAFIMAFRKIRQFRGDSPFWGWLRRVVVNHAISNLRKAPATEPVELQDFHGKAEATSDQVGMAMDLESALAILGAEDRAIVWLHDVEGYNHREIAGLFGKTESFSKTRLSRARNRLREVLDAGPKLEHTRSSVAR
jgi:RNA polymerase sigma factor (sigma-70 family)